MNMLAKLLVLAKKSVVLKLVTAYQARVTLLVVTAVTVVAAVHTFAVTQLVLA